MLDENTANSLNLQRRLGESVSDVIIRLARQGMARSAGPRKLTALQSGLETLGYPNLLREPLVVCRFITANWRIERK
jgi:hypothetical protein